MSESEEEEDYAVYGTPLDPLDEDTLPRKKPFALEDQVVKDKQGRRRFHGAFTGGFSAGFFNSVGSLEGWTPSTFKSSRSDKANKKTQGPKDFMDEEDMEEHGIAPNVLRATADFSDKRGQKRERPHQSDGPIPGKPVLQELLQPTRDTVGIKLLKQMGWKPGQGVGPRQTRSEKRRTKAERRPDAGRVYGCTMPGQHRPVTPDNSDSSSEDGDVTFAPDDLDPFVCKTKDNCFGIGYVGLDKRPVLSGHINLFEPSFLNMTEKNKKVSISGQAFGVGAFEEEDADIYAREDMSQYDFALESAARNPSKERKQRWSEVSRLAACIEGFTIASQPVARKKFFPPPTLPRDFQPVHTARKSRFEPAPEREATSEHSARRKGLGRHSLTAEDRSHIIGEAVRPPPPVEVKTEVTAEVAHDTPVEYSNALTATDAFGVSRFRPFVACPEKQGRYDKFLTLAKAEQKEGLSRLQPLSMTEWEREHERMEFEQAARLYRPMDAMIGDRFVSATQADDATNPLTAVERTRSEVDQQLTEAAKMKMFGRLTRQRTEWRPTSLLCKRFNIPEPFGGSSGLPTSEPHKRTKFSVFDFLDAAQQNSADLSPPVKEEEESETPPPKTLSRQVEPVPETSGTENSPTSATPVEGEPTTSSATAEKAMNLDSPDSLEKIDLFKAIFLSSSGESESEDEVNDEPKSLPDTRVTSIPTDERAVANIPMPPRKTPAEVFNNLERNTSPPRGIFANLDLDAVNARTREVFEGVDVQEQPSAPSVKTETVVIDIDDLSDDMFGPPLPSNLNSATTSHVPYVEKVSSEVASDSRWVEKLCKHPRKEKHSKKKSHKKEKKVSKHKHVKHKDKHKKKHKSKR